MFDTQARRAVAPIVEGIARGLHRASITPNAVTGAALAVAIAGSVLASRALWVPAALVWLVSRILDGVDGALARHQGTAGDNDLGGFLDIVFDFIAYGSFVVGCAIGQPDARLAILVLLLTYYVNGSAFLALSSIAEKRGLEVHDESGRTMKFVGGLAEGFETVVVHLSMALFSQHLATIAWVFAGVVGVTAVSRIRLAIVIVGAADRGRAAERGDGG